MSELIQSIEKSVAFLKSRHMDNTALLADLENLLEDLKARKEEASDETIDTEIPQD